MHEPKGVAAASSGEVYVADGAASGDWLPFDQHISGYVAFDSATPAYSHSTTTSDTVLNPTFSVQGTPVGFSGLSSPNARLRYDGTPSVHAVVNAAFSVKQASGTSKDIELALFKNGVEVTGTRSVRTISSGSWANVSFNTVITMATNDYVEVFIKADSAHTTQFAGAQLTIHAIPA